jgi:hypothetical protein
MNRRAVRAASIAALTIIATCAFALAVPATLWAGAMAGLPVILRPGVAVIIDASIMVYGLTALVKRAAGVPAQTAWLALGFSTAVSVAIQAAHVLVNVHAATTTPAEKIAAGVGLGVACLVPLCLLIASHFMLDIAVAPAPTKARRRAATVVGASAVKVPAARQPVVTAAAKPPVTVKAKSTPDDTTYPPLPSDAELWAERAADSSNVRLAAKYNVGKGVVQRAVQRHVDASQHAAVALRSVAA